MTLMNQAQVEAMMYQGGINRATTNMQNAEDNGRAHQNPYAQELFATFVQPLAKSIQQDCNTKRAGARHAHVILLSGLDFEAVAFLAVRHTISKLLSAKPPDHRELAYGLGLTVHRELVLEQIAEAVPELYHTLTQDFARRMSKDERHRMTVYRMQAEKAGVVINEWNIGSRDQVGMYLMELMDNAGLIEFGNEQRRGVKRVAREVFLRPDIIDRMDQIKSYVAVSMPTYGPCVEQPLDWAFGQQGGFHTQQVRRTKPYLVHGTRHSKTLAARTDMPVIYKVANNLQRTPWAVNTRILDTVYAVAKQFSTKEIVSLADMPKPAKPTFLDEQWATDVPKDQWPMDKMAAFLAWKHEMAEWHTQRKIVGVKYGRFYAATRAAEMFRDYPEIFFVYFADSRGRFYPLTYGLNPQGSDLSKALLHFAEGLPVADEEARLWFHVQGANKWGFDKATLQDRMAWVVERHDQIMGFAADPVGNSQWTEADSPLQFLAWCFEYAEFKSSPDTFVSHLPVSMDGSCNGLQNLSAMFRDLVGGSATNLTNNTAMRDIYADVAKAATLRLTDHVPVDEQEAKLKVMWLEHGISRKAVKRSVMTTPYGVTQRTATEYIIDDYLREGLGPTFDKTEYRKAANLLMGVVWPAIGDVVVKGREAMAWLKKASGTILKGFPADADPVIEWVTPSGFPASQAYFEAEVHRINTKLHGAIKIRVMSETDTPDRQRHANGLAPNFVHSMDAAHLHLTTAAAGDAGIKSLAMIHDDYGTHAANAGKLYRIIREQFAAMYLACDPPAMLAARYPNVAQPPSKGTLDILEVLESEYFFS